MAAPEMLAVAADVGGTRIAAGRVNGQAGILHSVTGLLGAAAIMLQSSH